MKKPQKISEFQITNQIMADKEFEEFSDLLDELPQHFKAADQTYK